MRLALLLVVFAGIFFSHGESFNLKGKHIRMTALNVTFQGKLRTVRKFFKLVQTFSLDVWKYPADKYDYALVIIQAKDTKAINKKFEKFGITGSAAESLTNDMKESMVNEFDRIKKRTKDGKVAFDINDANTFEEMVKKLKQWLKRCPEDLKCRLKVLGKTHEKNPIYMFSIGLKKEGEERRKKRNIFPTFIPFSPLHTTPSELSISTVQPTPNETLVPPAYTPHPIGPTPFEPNSSSVHPTDYSSSTPDPPASSASTTYNSTSLTSSTTPKYTTPQTSVSTTYNYTSPTSSTTPNYTTTQTTTTMMPPTPKKGVWIDCLIHAREWISGTTCMLFINKLITEYKMANVKKMLEKHDWHFVPVMNPDGYKYSWGFDVDKPREYPMRRLFRKNRSPGCKFPSLQGVDLNRNYDDGHWCVTDDKRYKEPCDFQLYCGPAAASEKETKAIQSQLTKKFTWLLCSTETLKAKDHLDLLLTVHNFANAWLYPTARTVGGKKKAKCDGIKKAEIAAKLKKLASAAEAASEKAGGLGWTSGPACEVLKNADGFLNAPGNLMDFAFEKAKIENSITVELRGPFFTIGDVKDVPAAFKETWDGVSAILNAL